MRHKIWLDCPANAWDEGLPLGNGRLGVMVTGGVQEDVLPLNEETVWYGGPRERTNPDAAQWLEPLRALLQRGEVERAEFFSRMAFSSCPKYLMPYLPLGNLRLTFPHHADYAQYRRELDIDNALARVCYQSGGVFFEREFIIAKEPNVIAIHFRASEPKRLTFCAHLERRPFEEHTACCGDRRTIELAGRCGEDGVRFCCAARLVASGGPVRALGDFLFVEDADEAWIYVSAATDFAQHDGYRQSCFDALDTACRLGFEEVVAKQNTRSSVLYGRVTLSINRAGLPDMPTNALLAQLRGGRDEALLDALVELAFHYGRYLLIASSTECALPATLQGIWNGTYQPPWESKYTININTQMNYWPAETCALAECHLPLFDLVERMAVRGRKTAREIYGCPGFVSHHNTDIWANTDPESITSSAMLWPMSGAWLALHFYEHYLFTQDKAFLTERALPVLREALAFFDAYLYKTPSGQLVTGPSLSPENVYQTQDGQRASICMAPTMDCQILRQLCRAYRKLCEEALQYDPLYQRAKVIAESLPKTQIGPDGCILEWQEPYKETEIGHRHLSHLFGVYPGDEITEDMQSLQAAAKRTLEKRLSAGGGHTGWSRAWIICLYARLKDGEKALEHLRFLLERSMMINLLDTHPPFQIDGNFGLTAAVAEMLLQSQPGCIDLLPACPAGWEVGEVTGLKARGAVTVDRLEWTGTSVSATVSSSKNQRLSIRCRTQVCDVELKAFQQQAVRFSFLTY